MVAADAPARFRYSPSMLRAPSWVMSENRLTTPISTMNAIAPPSRFLSGRILPPAPGSDVTARRFLSVYHFSAALHSSNSVLMRNRG